MDFVSNYIAKKPDDAGFINYTETENKVWSMLYQRQMKILPNRASDEFINGINRLNLSSDKIPQLPDVSEKLEDCSGWQVEPVEALISAREFFMLLAKRRFPAATFIRTLEELDYIKEPDIFHELFGHCPLLVEPVYADFVQEFALKVLDFDEQYWPLLQRLFWFTVEFGLIKTNKGLRAYGGGILSSVTETVYSVESELAMRVLFNPLVIFRTPYRIDMLQQVYFVIDSYQQLFELINQDLLKIMLKARELGEYPPFFKGELNNPNIHMMAC